MPACTGCSLVVTVMDEAFRGSECPLNVRSGRGPPLHVWPGANRHSAWRTVRLSEALLGPKFDAKDYSTSTKRQSAAATRGVNHISWLAGWITFTVRMPSPPPSWRSGNTDVELIRHGSTRASVRSTDELASWCCQRGGRGGAELAPPGKPWYSKVHCRVRNTNMMITRY